MGQKNQSSFRHAWARTVSRYFPDRELMLRTDGKVWFVKISHRLQLSVLFSVLIMSGWAIFTSLTFFINDKVIEAKDNQILNSRLIYRSLLSEVSDYQNKFASLTNELERNHTLMLNLVEKNATLQQNLRATESELATSQQRQDEIVAAKDNLKNELSKIQQGMRSLNTRNFELKGNLSSISSDLEGALSERNASRALANRLANQVARLKNELNDLQESEKDVIARLTRRASEKIDELETFVARTGLKPSKLVAGLEGQDGTAAGGPFIAYSGEADAGEHLKASITNLDSRLSQLETLEKLVNVMPLSPPLDHFSVSSHYGKRRDPINRRWAMHYGLDLSGVRGSTIFATAPGVVKFAGRKGKYGRLVVIDHGHGFKTRYGHLHKILVKRGQKVDYRSKIALLGSSGRSTGPHLHYEVLYNGRAHNPWKFIKAGRYVYKE
jgi:murein DD-endopeptidase MepM/ murein hydrolase activator NlpD